jgi:hypothetical protein
MTEDQLKQEALGWLTSATPTAPARQAALQPYFVNRCSVLP